MGTQFQFYSRLDQLASNNVEEYNPLSDSDLRTNLEIEHLFPRGWGLCAIFWPQVLTVEKSSCLRATELSQMDKIPLGSTQGTC